MFRLPESYDPARPVRILALDGGPNTLTNLHCLREIELERPGFLASVDVFAGTSDGALSGIYLANQRKLDIDAVDNAIDTLERMLLDVLSPNRLPALRRPLKRLLQILPRFSEKRALMQADKLLRLLSSTGSAVRMFSGLSTWADHHELSRFLTDELASEGGARKLGELRHGVCVVSYALGGEEVHEGHTNRKRQRPKIYTNFDDHPLFSESAIAEFTTGWHNEDLAEDSLAVALRSSSLPMFMPISEGHIDGAVYANNPTMCALTAILSHERRRHVARGMLSNTHTPWNPGDVLRGVVLMSMGADDTHFGGSNVQSEVAHNAELRWGWWSWLLRGLPFGASDILLLMDVVLNSDARATNFQAKQLLGERFTRVAPSGGRRTMEKFFSVLSGGAHELIAGSRATAAVWRKATRADKEIGWRTETRPLQTALFDPDHVELGDLLSPDAAVGPSPAIPTAGAPTGTTRDGAADTATARGYDAAAAYDATVEAGPAQTAAPFRRLREAVRATVIIGDIANDGDDLGELEKQGLPLADIVLRWAKDIDVRADANDDSSLAGTLAWIDANWPIDVPSNCIVE